MREPDLKDIDLNLLVVLRALLQTRGVSQAAERLGMSQPAVSRSLSRLRRQFGDRLLVKGNRSMMPTLYASELAAPLELLLEQTEAFFDTKPVFDITSTTRVFRLATTDYGAIAVLPQTLAQMIAQAPLSGLEVVGFGRDTFRMLSEGQIDLAFYSDDPVPTSLRTADLFNEDYICLISNNHPLTSHIQNGRIDMDNYLAYDHALVTVTGGRTGIVDDALRARGLKRRIAMWLPYFMTAALLVSRSNLVLTLPRRAAEEAANSFELLKFMPPIELETFGYRMIWHERTQRDGACLWLRNLISNSCASNQLSR
ncbi:LysR family transcriptional regulator [Asticcacaulis taihuensis]|uniref:DNA-binding transcriptional regulator, LysR family n=1 Tax=Asticcacaulis taihuensis TaxID=260084 RepID=A0A1G4TLJ5_9CAUL|nr:LysR family transcriptional regulator [Asticcacaulis taihuensis]SCW82172.1 DNA-binding transcriptional regulator, LysR family [Asticcacaulis taihuensis]